jgi:hypothetical protein
MFAEWKRIARESAIFCHALTCITNEDGIFVCPSQVFLIARTEQGAPPEANETGPSRWWWKS